MRARGHLRQGPTGQREPGGCRAPVGVSGAVPSLWQASSLDGRDTIELGCGTGYVSAWLARRGARPIGLENSAAQLTTARELQRQRVWRVSAAVGLGADHAVRSRSVWDGWVAGRTARRARGAVGASRPQFPQRLRCAWPGREQSRG